MSKPLQELINLETEMHQSATRKNPARMNELLHKDFSEIGRSGRVYSRQDILHELINEAELPQIHAEQFQLQQLGESLFLLTYVSAHSSDKLYRYSRRTSIWIKEADVEREGEEGGRGGKEGEEAETWKIRFHQGTPLPQ